VRHNVTILPQPYRPVEPGAVSPLDSESAVSVSTFRPYEELGLAYGKVAGPKATVTPEIAALADDITRNIDGHRAQAAAIDAWVKKNIQLRRDLAVGRAPGSARRCGDPAQQVRDCKDRATLMAALLAAKGIDSEAVLINLGNAYTLPEPPTMVAINHAMLYLPEFDLYDDPTMT
jgi:transglutaminase-like putative cysteine protease